MARALRLCLPVLIGVALVDSERATYALHNPERATYALHDPERAAYQNGRALAIEDYYRVQNVAGVQISPNARWVTFAVSRA